MNTDVHLLGNYKTSVYSCGTGHEPIKCKGLPFCRDNPFLFYVEFIVTADVGNFLLFQVYNTLNSYPSSFRKSMARGNAYCRFPLHQDFKESWKVMMEPLRA